MTDITIPPREPWDELPETVERLRRVALDHQETREDCGDHSIEGCTCGAHRREMPKDIFDAGPEARRKWRDEDLGIGHRWRWLDHFTEVWNEAAK